MTKGTQKTGKLFANKRAVSIAAQTAIDAALSYGVEQVRLDSPVDTERLQDGWYTTKDGIKNDVPYTIFQEDGTRRSAGKHMLRRNIPKIERYLMRKAQENVIRGLS
jgi:hypothetical protein